MISTERPEPPPDLHGENSRGGKELARWKAYYIGLKEGKKKRKPSFSAYTAESVRRKLDKIFRGKCSYCERDVANAGEIEHYRPKNAVELEDGTDFEVDLGNGTFIKQGYWWLGMEWSNLLYACPWCNQIRLRVAGEEDPLVRAGKGKKFPLLDEANRAKEPEQEKDEDPLLLDPCHDHPEQHLFIEIDPTDKRFGMMLPQRQADGSKDPKGRITIDVFELNNAKTLERRKTTLRRINNRKQEAQKAFQRVNDLPPGEARQEAIRVLKSKIAELRGYLQPGESDLLMTQQTILPFLYMLGVQKSPE